MISSHLVLITALFALWIVFAGFAFKKKAPKGRQKREIFEPGKLSTSDEEITFLLESGQLREEFLSANENGEREMEQKVEKKVEKKLENKHVPKPRGM